MNGNSLAAVRSKASKAFKSYNFSAFLALTSANAVSSAFGFLTTIAIANALGPSEYGSIVFGYALGGVAVVIVRYATDKTLVKQYVELGDDFNELLWGGVFLKLIMLALVLGGGVVLYFSGFIEI